jgi:Predicted membrane protein (DUF2232)
MLNRFGVPVGAGLASALLFIVTIKGTMLALALAYLAPLPIMIAALGWGFLSGIIALGVACAGVAGAIEPVSGLLFAATIALPAWALASFSQLPGIRVPWRKTVAPSEWVSVGTIVTLATIFSALIGVGALTALIVVYGGYENGLRAFADVLEPAIDDATGGVALLPEGETANEFAMSIVRLSPAAIAASTLLMFAVNLYAAARSTAMSQRLRRPWPDVPSAFALSPSLGAVALAALALAFALPTPANQFAWVVVGALGAAFGLQGIAVLHALSRGLPLRPWLLGALYFCCVIRSNWALPAIACVGLIESFAALRARAAASKSKI